MTGQQETLPEPDERPFHLPLTVQWLSGEGAGSWFLVEAAERPLQYRVTRFSPGGMIECEGLFKAGRALVLKKKYSVTYPSDCSKVTVMQEGEQILLKKIG